MWMDNWVLSLPKEFWQSSTVLFRFFETQKTVVVLANSNQAEQEVRLDQCAALDIPVLRRKGGGGTVVLGPGCLVLTFAFYAKDLFANARYFHLINTLWIRALASAGCHGLSQGGVSDLCIGDKKVGGTSLFRRKHLLVYQGSLLVNPNLSMIETLLKHPSKEPSYRGGRSHSQFLTTIAENGCSLSASALARRCQEHFSQTAEQFFAPEIAINHPN